LQPLLVILYAIYIKKSIGNLWKINKFKIQNSKFKIDVPFFKSIDYIVSAFLFIHKIRFYFIYKVVFVDINMNKILNLFKYFNKFV